MRRSRLTRTGTRDLTRQHPIRQIRIRIDNWDISERRKQKTGMHVPDVAKGVWTCERIDESECTDDDTTSSKTFGPGGSLEGLDRNDTLQWCVGESIDQLTSSQAQKGTYEKMMLNMK